MFVFFLFWFPLAYRFPFVCLSYFGLLHTSDQALCVICTRCYIPLLFNGQTMEEGAGGRCVLICLSCWFIFVFVFAFCEVVFVARFVCVFFFGFL